MTMEFAKAAPEKLADFLTFIARFAKTPQSALQPYIAVDDEDGKKQFGELILFCGLGAGCGILLMAIGQALGMAEDSSRRIASFSQFDSKILPVAVALAIIILSAVWHGLTRVIGTTLGRLIPDFRFDGTLQNSVNAGLAFGAFYVPVICAVLVAIRLGVAHTTLSWVVYIIASIALGIAFVVYFVLAFAALHQVLPARYYFLFCCTGVCTYYLVSLAVVT